MRFKVSGWLAAALTMAASGFLVLIIAARTLSPEDNATFLVFWSAVYGLTGSLAGIQNEASRALASVPPNETAPPRGRARVVPTATAVGVALALLAALTGLFWLPPLLNTDHPWLALILMAFAVTAYAGHNAAVGAFMGSEHMSRAAGLIAGEALLRLTLFGIVAVAGAGLGGYWAATVVPMAFWILILTARHRLTETLSLRGPDTVQTLTRNMMTAIGAGACTSLLVNGYPAILKAASGSTEPRLAVIILAISLTRAPLLVPVISFQGAIVAWFVREAARPARTLTLALCAVWALTATVAFGMGILGPWVMVLLYGPSYTIDGSFMAWLAVGAGATGTLVVTASRTLARGSHAWFLAAWVSATTVSLATLAAPLPLETRVILSLTTGPAAGSVAALMAPRRTPAVPESATVAPPPATSLDG